MTIASLKTKQFNAGLEPFNAGTFQKIKVHGNYYETLVYQDLSAGKHTRKVYVDGFLKMDVLRFYKCALQVRVQGRRLELVIERCGNEKAICVVLALVMGVCVHQRLLLRK